MSRLPMNRKPAYLQLVFESIDEEEYALRGKKAQDGEFPLGGVPQRGGSGQTALMKKRRVHSFGKRPKFRKTYAREWRKHRDLTLQAAAEKIADYLRDHEYAMSYAYTTLGRLEQGVIAYTQPVVEAMAHVYGIDEASLIMRPPGAAPLWEEVPEIEGEATRFVLRRVGRK